MAAQDKQRSSAIQWAGLGVEAIRAGRFADGRDHLVRALRLDKANPFYHFDLALAHHGLGDIEEAARELCTAIRLKPDFDDASRRLGMLCARYLFESDGVLDGFALRTAMQAPRASQQALAEAAISELARHGSLAQPLAAIAREGADATARNLLTKRTDDALRDDTLLAALEWGVNKNLTVERMLTALRRAVLLDVPPGRFEDKALQAFTIALAKHCVANEHVWAETPEETAAIEHLKPLLTGLPLGEFQATRAVLLIALYRPLSSFLPAGQTSAVKLRALRDWAAESLKNEQAEIALAKTLTAGPLPGDATGKRVAQQYEKAPYPRWTSLTMPNTGSLKLALRQFFSPDRLTFLEREFNVLIAGCGTGRQAIQSALGYGENATVLGLDISARSLAYATRMAQGFGIPRLAFEQADLLAPDAKQRTFDIIECVGVLHHMADPLAGWRSLLGRLKPHGLMMLGLYSPVSRKVLSQLRQEPAFPGAGCTDAAARAYRQSLLARTAAEPGGDLAISKDAYTLSEFRDLALHEQEHPLTLAEIDAFMSAEKLAFRGFILPGPSFDSFHKQFPEPASLLRLADWAAHEAEHPNLFDGMYCFWCERVV